MQQPYAKLRQWAMGGYREGEAKTPEAAFQRFMDTYRQALYPGRPLRDPCHGLDSDILRPHVKDLVARGIDPQEFLTACIEAYVAWRKNGASTQPCPKSLYPNMIVGEWGWRAYYQWSVRAARQYRAKPQDSAQARGTGVTEALTAALAAGRATYERLPVKDLSVLVTVAPGALPPTFWLVWPSIRRRAHILGGEIARAWEALRENAAAVALLDITAAELGAK